MNDPFGLTPMAAYFSNASVSSDTAAFLQRASLYQGASTVETPTGGSLVGALSGRTDVERLAIHGHMWSGSGGGIRGTGAGPSNGNSLTGVYGDPAALAATHGYIVGADAATVDAVAQAMATSVAKDGAVDLFGCDSAGLAQSLSTKLTALGRGDVVVSGAVGSTVVRTQKNRDIGLKNTWNSFKGGAKIESRKGVSFR